MGTSRFSFALSTMVKSSVAKWLIYFCFFNVFPELIPKGEIGTKNCDYLKKLENCMRYDQIAHSMKNSRVQNLF
jgi:hypothetical protein